MTPRPTLPSRSPPSGSPAISPATPSPALPAALLWIAFASFASIGLQGGALGVAWLSMQATFDKTLESLGVLLAAATVGGLLVSFYGGRIVARVGVGRFCLAGALAGLIGLAGVALTPTWAGLVVAVLLVGLGRAGINVGVNTFVAVAYPTSRMNWLHAVFGVGSTLGPLLVTLIVVGLARPWQLSYGVMAAFQGVVAVLFLATLEQWRLTEPSAPTPRPEGVPGAPRRGASMRASLRLAPVWLGVTLFVAHTGIQVSAGGLTNNLFVEGRGIDPQVAGVWVGLFWASITAGRLAFGGLVDRAGVADVLRFATVGTVLGALLLWWNPLDAVGFLGLVLMGFTLAPVFPSSISRTPGLVGAVHSPNAIGVQLAGAALGGALVPSVIGYLGDNLDLAVIPPCLVAFALAQVLIHELLTLQERRRLVSAAKG